jgi:hypothetical protein
MATDRTAYAPGQKVHKFELAGLGAAPYRFEGVEHRVFRAAPDAPAQPGGSCDYCGTGISYFYWLRSADGKRFKVGCDCILKTTSERSLVVAVKTAAQAHAADLRRERAERARLAGVARIAAAVAQLPALESTWKNEPHPRAGQGAYFDALTRWDWAIWMLDHAGMTGRLTVATAIEKALASSAAHAA